MTVSALNLERIVEAKRDHDSRCDYPSHTVILSPFDVTRLGWEDGDEIAGLRVASDPAQQPEHFHLLCDRPSCTSGSSTSTADFKTREKVPA